MAFARPNRGRILVDERGDGSQRGYFLSGSDLRRMWEAAREEALGRPVRLDRGADYDVTKAMIDFEYVLARDSSYLEALHQYARLWREHEVPERAIELGEAEIRLAPKMADAHVDLLASYRQYVAWTRPQTALQWLEARGTPYARYVAGEVHRRDVSRRPTIS